MGVSPGFTAWVAIDARHAMTSGERSIDVHLVVVAVVIGSIKWPESLGHFSTRGKTSSASPQPLRGHADQ